MSMNLLERVQRYDAQRPNLPAEHWLTFGAGLALWIVTRRHPSLTVRLLASLGATLLVVRATSGTQVPPPLARLPFANAPTRARDLIG